MPGYKIAFATTAGSKKVFPATPVAAPFFNTSGVHASFPIVVPGNPFFTTSGIQYSFATSIKDNPFFNTSGVTSAFPTVIPDDSSSKLLKLRLGEFTVASDLSLVTAYDTTGEYDANTNPGGYNPQADPVNFNRAKRSEVGLYLAYRVWKDTNIPDTVFPSTIDPSLDPWEYELAVEDSGVYQLFMIAAPTSETYADVYNKGNSVYEYASNAPLWYATQGAAIIDKDVINCLNKRRYNFLESVMCGSCDEDYLAFYAKYIGALNAFSIGTNESYIEGMQLWNELKEECAKIGCNCCC